MSSYVCYRCGTRVEIKNANVDILCPNCACKILIKESPAITKRVECD